MVFAGTIHCTLLFPKPWQLTEAAMDHQSEAALWERQRLVENADMRRRLQVCFGME